MSSNVLSPKNANAIMAAAAVAEPENKPAVQGKAEVRSLEYHRQVLQSRMEDAMGQQQQYVSPSDNIMSPCTAKLNAYRNKQVTKAKPKSLFAQASAKKFEGDNLFGAAKGSSAKSTSAPKE